MIQIYINNYLNNSNKSFNTLKEFILQLENTLQNINLSNNTFIVRDINDFKLSLINIQTAEEIEICVDYNKFSNNYFISKDDFLNLNLGSEVSIKEKIVTLKSSFLEFNKIQNLKVKNILEDMYFCLNEEKNATYLIEKIENNKIYLTNISEGGFFSIPQEKYPLFQKGNLVKISNGKYIEL